jgi:hypothetical protein
MGAAAWLACLWIELWITDPAVDNVCVAKRLRVTALWTTR